MTTEPYTPDETELCDSYAGVMNEYAGQSYDQAEADAERGIAKIKADALREFGKSLIKDSGPETDQRIFDPWDVDQLANRVAQRIEGEA